MADLSLRVSGREEEENTNLHHDGSVLSRTQSGLDRIDGVELDHHFLDLPGCTDIVHELSQSVQLTTATLAEDPLLDVRVVSCTCLKTSFLTSFRHFKVMPHMSAVLLT